MKEPDPKPKRQVDGYHGHILGGSYSQALQSRIESCIWYCKGFDKLGGPAMPYIAAWHAVDNTIWYEFVSRRLVELLDCDYSNAPERFRTSVVERHRYTREVNTCGFFQEILKSSEVDGKKFELREEVVNQGALEAVYKVRTPAAGTCWIKDQATLESYEQDGIFVSLGNLTIVTKEMEAEELLKEMQQSLKRSEKKYRELSILDDLTGLFNTRYLYKSLTALIRESTAKAEPFSLVFMDIDNFKQVVDTNGHLNASRTLREIAATIRATLEEPAYGVAYGGDEFVVTLPGFDKLQALQLADEIRIRIKETTYLQNANLNIRVSASLGIATFPDDARTLTDLLALADHAMFSVKERGKDSICGISLEPQESDVLQPARRICYK
jgi:diguanylate cyclase (GGDEF)-like protein